jgi:hypothetical protein
MPDHSALQALLQDRKTSTKGRASRRMGICLSAPLSMTLALAEQELDAAKAAAETAQDNAETRAGGKISIDPALTKQVKAAEKAVAEAEAAVDAASVTVTFTALKAKDYDALLKEHPPRDGNKLDAAVDRNESTFPDALMLKSATKVEDADGNLVDMDIPELLETLSNGERIIACQAANSVNDRTVNVDFSDANSQSRQRSGSSSNRR